jgi:hypothetical protein
VLHRAASTAIALVPGSTGTAGAADLPLLRCALRKTVPSRQEST